MSFLRSKHHKHKSVDNDEVNQYAELEELKNFHSGWLTKSALFRSKQLYCTLTCQWLSFWKDTAEHQEAAGQKKSDSIDMCTATQVMRSNSAKVHNAFDIVISKERITLSAPNMKECDTWIQKLQIAMQYNKRAASIRQSLSSLARSSELELASPSTPVPLYEDPFDSPSASNTPISKVEPAHEQPQSIEPPPLPTDRKPSSPMDPPSASNGTTTSPVAVTTSPVKPKVALYEEVDLSLTPTGKPAPPVPDAEKTIKPQPAARHSIEDKDSLHTPKPVPRPSIRKTKPLMPALPEGDADEDDVTKQEETIHNQVEMRSSVSTQSDEKGLPSVNDLYAAVQKNNEKNATSDRLSSIWAAMEERKPDHISTKLEQESQAISDLRRLLNVKTASSIITDQEITHKPLERGKHMQALHDFLYN